MISHLPLLTCKFPDLSCQLLPLSSKILPGLRGSGIHFLGSCIQNLLSLVGPIARHFSENKGYEDGLTLHALPPGPGTAGTAVLDGESFCDL